MLCNSKTNYVTGTIKQTCKGNWGTVGYGMKHLIHLKQELLEMNLLQPS